MFSKGTFRSDQVDSFRRALAFLAMCAKHILSGQIYNGGCPRIEIGEFLYSVQILVTTINFSEDKNEIYMNPLRAMRTSPIEESLTGQ
jgi:hypothetical protein